ncbi:Cell division protein FtsI/penicillin-binding protein 2 [Micromonospora pallida]|uniref:Cell division protein FtsI/penicillin-binding protein 2 n=1 Tax=Micromonospora pallida TaxID=145854 RepID=A0A1C6TIY4_9ACTN|nr:penicillin-binding transpeptidase domain-containing protein [Micromonospora pallida]SCL41533.1 Cell division protein FtsI/penicillin-binding protein 2 [Micromonospora pallida]
MPLTYPPRRSRTRRLLAAVFAVVVTGTVLVGCSDSDGPEDSVDAFLAGWRSGDLHAVGFRDPTGARVPAERVVEEIRELSGALADQPPTLRRSGEPTITRDSAEGRITVEWTLPGDTRWAYERPIRLVRGGDDAWQVIWEPSLVHEALLRGDRLAVRRVVAPRAAVLDGAGAPIVAARPVVRVGVQPNEVTDAAALARQLDAAFRAIRPAITPPVDVSDLPKQLADAKPDAFVEVVTLRAEAYQQIRPRIYDLPGTKFREEKLELAPTREFARALLGSVDPATADDLAAKPDVYAEGDQVGHGGLQGRYDERLRGTVGLSVGTERRGSDGTWARTETEVFRKDPQPGEPLRTTLDPATQNAADAALRGERRRAALVAVRISDGALLAVANGPGAAGENLAFNAQVPPGSTFKMVSTLGLLDRGAVTLDGPVDCPKTFTVDGRTFKNSDNFALGKVPFRTDFAKSCNTAFAALAPKLDANGLADTGRALGLEATWNLGVDAFTGKVSTGGSPAELAAAAFGQGTTLVSPVAMAAATAAVARGRWEQPKLLLDPAPGQPAPAGPQLTPEHVDPLRTMMREVVTKGTATALRGVPGDPVHGKTGTAEYDDNPANTHSWFVGWQGDIAVAVFVEKGGSSADSAVPITARFLRALA